jgi:hypothetical protein
MALKIHNRKPRIQNAKPFVSFGRTGVILLNKTASQLLGLSPGSCIEFGNDPQNVEDWFIRKTKSSEYVLRYNTDKALICSGQLICKDVKQSTENPINRTVQYGIVPTPQKIDGTEWYLLITNHTKIIER